MKSESKPISFLDTSLAIIQSQFFSDNFFKELFLGHSGVSDFWENSIFFLKPSSDSIALSTEKITDESKPPLKEVPILRSASNLNLVAS